MATSDRFPELLAPAGDWDALRSACANGADAVYFGLEGFNARHRATNFTLDELPTVMQFLHQRNVRGFITLNTLIFSGELESVADYVRRVAESGADAVIVQDLGLASLIRRMAPDLPIHASTQMTLTEPRGADWARRELGVRRIVLARELSVEEIGKIARAVDVPIEVFVHGALCVAYSGQCLTSEALGGRSANRGQCAQACRLPYEMVVDGQVRELGDRAYLLSPQDLAGHEFVRALIDAGVVSFKIEGRLKGPEYVAAAVRTYRDAIDEAKAGRSFEISVSSAVALQQTYSRGFTPGFLEGPNHQRLVPARFPKNRGVYLGRVVHSSRRSIRIRWEAMPGAEINVGDGIVFDIGKPETAEPGGRVDTVERWDERHWDVVVRSESVESTPIPVGSRVWKTDDPALRKELRQTYVGDPIARRTPLLMVLEGRIGGALSLTAAEPNGESVRVEWPGPIAPARNRPTSADEARGQLDRLGDSPFDLAQLDYRVPEGAMLPRSVLNDLRREAVTQLEQRRGESYRIAIVEPNALVAMRTALVVSRPSELADDPPKLSVLVRSEDQLHAVLGARPETIYLDFEDARRYREAVVRCTDVGVRPIPAVLRILKPGEEGWLKVTASAGAPAVLVRNLGTIGYFREHHPEIELIGDHSLNVANELTADLLTRAGLSRLTPSFDLNWEQFADLIETTDPHRWEPVIHQHMPMFHNEFCVFAAFLSSGKDWRDCGRPCDRHRVELRDRTGALFQVLADNGCRNTVFNAVPQSAAQFLNRMMAMGLRRFRIDLLRETADEAVRLIMQYRQVLTGREDGRQVWTQLKALNQLGVTRGTLNLV